jgi:hypothetical protein
LEGQVGPSNWGEGYRRIAAHPTGPERPETGSVRIPGKDQDVWNGFESFHSRTLARNHSASFCVTQRGGCLLDKGADQLSHGRPFLYLEEIRSDRIRTSKPCKSSISATGSSTTTRRT